jgi:hypothetical protein
MVVAILVFGAIASIMASRRERRLERASMTGDADVR